MGKKSGHTKSPKDAKKANNGSCNMKNKKGSKINIKNVCIMDISTMNFRNKISEHFVVFLAMLPARAD